MSEDEPWTSAGEAETKLIEVPTRLAEQREKWAEEETMVLDVKQRSSQGAFDDDADEETTLIDMSCLRQTQRRKLGIALLDGEEATPFLWQNLERVGDHERRGIDELCKLLPPAAEMGEICDALAKRMEDLVGWPHQVRWHRAGTAIASGRSFEWDEGVWTWGRMPPDHNRFIAGVQHNLADRWCFVLSSGDEKVDGDFAFGMTTFLINEFCAKLCDKAQWPPFSWAINPMEKRDLEVMMLSGESPLLELSFDVRFDAGSGSLRLWFPMGLVRQIKALSERRAEFSEDAASAWWGGLTICRPVVAGVTMLRSAELEKVGVGDVVVVERHGVELGEVSASAIDGGARWMIGDDSVVAGRLSRGGDDGWRFEVLAEQSMTDPEEVDVSETSEDEAAPTAGVAVQEAKLELEVRLGNVEMKLSDVARLRPGQVIDCERPVGSAVELVVRGASVGRGELVSVDGKLGVRILTTSRRS